ncbi:hypothetical protein ANN_07695 [Periplaneta americana]|uniref:DUF4817 domain-containing protein n=1 Tax=Periplaneta americana TaxID=6978 RepID=A0ABQ8SZZ7_PERAM|nr:hypothetical protein ANN_07695 [Periplaneta americana]
MAGLCKGGNEPLGSLKAKEKYSQTYVDSKIASILVAKLRKLNTFRILSVDDAQTRFIFVDCIDCQNGDTADESANRIAEFKSIVRVQREYRRVLNHDAPTAKSIKKWHDTFLATGSVLKKHGGGRRTSDEMVANVQAAYERSPRKSLRRASRELQVPKSILQQLSTNVSNCTHTKCS